MGAPEVQATTQTDRLKSFDKNIIGHNFSRSEKLNVSITGDPNARHALSQPFTDKYSDHQYENFYPQIFS